MKTNKKLNRHFSHFSIRERISFIQSFNNRMFKQMESDLTETESLLTQVMIELNEAYDLIDKLQHSKTNKKIIRIDFNGH